MLKCEIPKGDMLPNPVYVVLDKTGLDFGRAQDAARNLAKKLYWDPMLFSWFDKNAGKHSPQDVICCTEGKPGWVEYARSRVVISLLTYVTKNMFLSFGGEKKSRRSLLEAVLVTVPIL
jgi:hypothetical protein